MADLPRRGRSQRRCWGSTEVLSSRAIIHSVRRWIRIVALAGCLIAGVAVSARAQPRPSDARRAAPLTRFVPASASFFVNIRKLDDLDRALTRAHAWQLIPLVMGGAPVPAPVFSLRQSVRDYFGPKCAINVDELMPGDVAVVASTWEHLSSGFWMARVADPGVIDRCFPTDRRFADSIASGSGFITDTGLLVCVKDRVAVLSPNAQNELAQRAADLLGGSRSDSVENDAVFQQLWSHLPANPLALVYSARGVGEQNDSTARRFSIWADIERTVVGLYEGDGHVDLAIRAALATPRPSVRLTDSAIERMLQLPQTTLGALVMSVDFQTAIEAALGNASPSAMSRYLALAMAFRGLEVNDVPLITTLGPHVIVAWDQDLRLGSSAPQVAILVECKEPKAALRETEALAANLLEMIRGLEPALTDATLRIERATRLGTALGYIPFTDHAQKSKLPLMRMLANVSPAWTVSDRWLIVATTRNHLERILDAQYDLIPPLRAVPDVYRLSRAPTERTMMSVFQAGLASDVLARWIKDFEAGRPSLLHASWWTQPARRQKQLGIGMRAAQEPGVVVVARVQPGSHAEGRLWPGDRILGVDGQLLSLDGPNADLRTRIKNSAAAGGPTLRVLREGRAIDVALPSARPEKSLAPRVAPADLVRELAAVARALDFVSFAALASDDRHYSARLTLRFAPITWPESRP